MDTPLTRDGYVSSCQGDGGRSSTPQRSWGILSLYVHAQMTAEPDPKTAARCWSCGPPLPARYGMVPCDVDTDAVSCGYQRIERQHEEWTRRVIHPPCGTSHLRTRWLKTEG